MNDALASLPPTSEAARASAQRFDQRRARTAAREAGIGAPIPEAEVVEAEVVLAEAATRDDRAEERDSVADERELAAALDAFLHPDADQYDATITARRASAIDRTEAQSDRLSSLSM